MIDIAANPDLDGLQKVIRCDSIRLYRHSHKKPFRIIILGARGAGLYIQSRSHCPREVQPFTPSLNPRDNLVISEPNMYVLGWKNIGVPEETPQVDWNNIQTPPIKAPGQELSLRPFYWEVTALTTTPTQTMRWFIQRTSVLVTWLMRVLKEYFPGLENFLWPKASVCSVTQPQYWRYRVTGSASWSPLLVISTY